VESNHTLNGSLNRGSIFKLDRNGLVIELHQEPTDRYEILLGNHSDIPHELHRGKKSDGRFGEMNSECILEQPGDEGVLNASLGLDSSMLNEGCNRYLFASSSRSPITRMLACRTFHHAFQPFDSSDRARHCDTYNSSRCAGAGVSPSLEVVTSGTANRATVARSLGARMLELRLNRALRRFQDQVRHRIQRRCELKLFVVLRMQYVFRSRSRTRAALAIQRFIRKKQMPPPQNILHGTS
jgi:hypothetical protein